ncbi:hypothetical protein BHE74_00031925 [Ensete ventricosum]|nr:hypothetical protein BHE74_00031925 [Ensete ventricosum]
MCVMFRWIRDQQKSEEVLVPGDDVFIILRLDGRVRKSGKQVILHCSYSWRILLPPYCIFHTQGMPDWQEIVKELPPMEDLLSKLER